MTPSIQDHDPKHQTSDVPQTLSGSESCSDGGLNKPEQTTPPPPPPYSLFTKKQRWLILGLGTISVSTTHLNLHLHPSHTKFTTSPRLVRLFDHNVFSCINTCLRSEHLLGVCI